MASLSVYCSRLAASLATFVMSLDWLRSMSSGIYVGVVCCYLYG